MEPIESKKNFLGNFITKEKITFEFKMEPIESKKNFLGNFITKEKITSKICLNLNISTLRQFLTISTARINGLMEQQLGINWIKMKNHYIDQPTRRTLLNCFFYIPQTKRAIKIKTACRPFSVRKLFIFTNLEAFFAVKSRMIIERLLEVMLGTFCLLQTVGQVSLK
ncbi:hypothetical protein QE152_g17022 [Popillia japonica]|uniref:Uncharacterized protein n=1 Tax=Popillia japonica TaxID=7064 RepID=A0AAW1L6J9_POPJA